MTSNQWPVRRQNKQHFCGYLPLELVIDLTVTLNPSQMNNTYRHWNGFIIVTKKYRLIGMIVLIII